MITLAHWEGKKKTLRAAGQISRQATGKRPGAPNGQSAPGLIGMSFQETEALDWVFMVNCVCVHGHINTLSGNWWEGCVAFSQSRFRQESAPSPAPRWKIDWQMKRLAVWRPHNSIILSTLTLLADAFAFPSAFSLPGHYSQASPHMKY